MNILARPSRKIPLPSSSPKRSQLQAHFLERLTRLQRMRAEIWETLDSEQRRILGRALYSTYWDCVNLGLRDDAQGIIQPLTA